MTVPEAMDMFDKPGNISSFKPVDHKGQLIMIWPHAVKPHTEDDGTVKDVTEVDVVVLDAPGGVVRYEGVNMFQKYLQARVRRNVGSGRANLGRLVQRPPNKPKNDPAWDLDDPTEADMQLARAYLRNPAAANTVAPSFATGGTVAGGNPPF